jgi:hypothetical protein
VSLTTDNLLKFCFVGLAVCALVAIVIGGQAMFSADAPVKEAVVTPAATTPPANTAPAVTKSTISATPTGSQTANIEAKDDAPTLSPPRDIFGTVPRKVQTIRVGADGKLVPNP